MKNFHDENIVGHLYIMYYFEWTIIYRNKILYGQIYIGQKSVYGQVYTILYPSVQYCLALCLEPYNFAAPLAMLHAFDRMRNNAFYEIFCAVEPTHFLL